MQKTYYHRKYDFQFTQVKRLNSHKLNNAFARQFPSEYVSYCVLKILALTYCPGPLIICKNFLGQICCRTTFEMHVCYYAPGAVCFQICDSKRANEVDVGK